MQHIIKLANQQTVIVNTLIKVSKWCTIPNSCLPFFFSYDNASVHLHLISSVLAAKTHKMSQTQSFHILTDEHIHESNTRTPRSRAWVQIAAATLSGNSLGQTVHTHQASVHQAAKLVAALLRIARVTAGLVESNGSLLLGLWLTSPAGWLPRTRISSGTLRSLIKYGLPLPFTFNTITHINTYKNGHKVLIIYLSNV